MLSDFNGQVIGATANEAITAYLFVDLGGTTTIEDLKCSIADNGDQPFGIATETVASGEDVGIAYSGIGRLTVLGNSVNIAAGDAVGVATDNSGKGVKVATTAGGTWYGAIALEPATTDNAVIRVEIRKGYMAENVT